MEYRELLSELSRSPTARDDLPTVASVLSSVQGGGLAAAARHVPTEALLVDRGDGGRLLGGGPTVPRDLESGPKARAVLERSGKLETLSARARELLSPGGAPLPAPGPDLHNVVIASPGDALETAGAEAAYRKHRPHLIDLHDVSAPEAAADRLLATLEQFAPRPLPKGAEGRALFLGVSLGLPEGGEDREAFARFLGRAQAGLKRREVSVALLYTGGSLSPKSTPSGGLVDARHPFVPERFREKGRRVLDLVPGFTDVGCLAVAYLSRP